MKISAFLLVCLLALQLVEALPTPEEVTIVRSKRKISELEGNKNNLPSLPTVVNKSDDLITEKPESTLDGTTTENPEINPEHHDTEVKNVRAKKQTCVQVPMGTKTICGDEKARQLKHQEMVILQPEPAQVLQMPSVAHSARTIEPIYSFGPVNVNGAGYGSSASSYGASGYGAYSLRPFSAGSSGSSHSQHVSYSPYQYQAVMPYTMVQHPLVHHSLTINRGLSGLAPGKAPQIVYYEAPEQVYVDAAEESTVVHSAEQAPSPTLYCQTMKHKELAKALYPAEEKANATVDDGHIQEHIQRVNEIKEEISQLNQAAQRIVDQQEHLAKMQQEHLSVVSAQNGEHMLMRSVEPILMRHQQFQKRTPPFGSNRGGRRPFFREAEEPLLSQNSQVDDQELSKNPSPSESPLESQRTYAIPYAGMEQPLNERQYYPNYGYGYGSPPLPYHMRSETGFNVPTYYRSNTANTLQSEDDAKFFKRVVDMGQRMGIISQDVKPVDKVEEKTQSEDALTDLAYGGKSVSQPIKVPIIPTMDTDSPATPAKKDKRGLIQKKR